MLVATQSGEYLVLQADLGGTGGLTNIGVLLVDPAQDQAYLRIRRDLASLVEDDTHAEWLEALQSDLEQKAAEMGGAALLAWMETTLSNFLRVGDREAVLVDRYPATLYRLYRRHVPAGIRAFETHLPRFSLEAAAGKFGEQREVDAEPEEWDEAPPGLRLTEGMFVARVVGRSMEPRIPDGSLCVFRAPVTGSRNGRLLLVENYAESEHGGRYTVKRYRSRKVETGEDTWGHDWIQLEPLNPEFESWRLPPEQVRVLAEFVCVLD